MCIILIRSTMARPPRLRGAYDLMAVMTLTALLALCVVFTSSVTTRVAFGLPFILFIPGYALVAALFPRRGSLSGIERVALSVILSLAIVPLTGLALNYVWEISLYPIVVSLVCFVAGMCALALLRRTQLPVHERFDVQVGLPTLRWGPQSRVDRILAIAMAIALIGAVGTSIYVGTRPMTADRFSEFYLLGLEGSMEYYPGEILIGADATVTVGVTNHEGREMTYRLRITIDGTEILALDVPPLQDGEAWEQAAHITPATTGDNQQVEFFLYRADDPEPYRRLHLWIDVRDPTTPPSTP